MTESEKKRQSIFDKYSSNLNLLVSTGILTGITLKYKKAYICPICENQFSEDSLIQSGSNPLTLEDVPPITLGGKASILTCRECNGRCGTNIDFHLTNRMKELDDESLLPKEGVHVKIEAGDKSANAKITLSQDGTIQAKHSEKKNHPEKLLNFVSSVKQDTLVNIKFYQSKVDPFKFQLALLKIGYLQTFHKFGYSFIFNASYSLIREQLKNPDKNIYLDCICFPAPYPKEYFGEPLVTEKGLGAIMPIFELVTLTSRVFAVILPLPNYTPKQIAWSFKKNLSSKKEMALNMKHMNDDFLTDINAIQQLITFMTTINQNL